VALEAVRPGTALLAWDSVILWDEVWDIAPWDRGLLLLPRPRLQKSR
jgi:hypothetical protein